MVGNQWSTTISLCFSCIIACSLSTIPQYVYAVEIYSTNFNSKLTFNREWEKNRTVGLRDGRKANTGHGLGMVERSYARKRFTVPPGTRKITIRFWLRVGHKSFSPGVSNNARLKFRWQHPTLGWREQTIDQGKQNSGVANFRTIEFSGDEIGTDHYVYFQTSGSISRYFIDDLTVVADVGPDNFSVESAQSNASVCTKNQISIAVRDANNNIISDFTGRISLSTSTGHGNWSMVTPNGNLNTPRTDNGQAGYQFQASDQGRVDLLLSNEHAETLKVNVSHDSGSASGISGDIRFSENSFVLDYGERQGRDIIAYRPHAVVASLIKRDPNNGECGIATSYQSSSVSLSFSNISPDSMAIPPQWLINGSAVEASLTASSVPLRFSNGIAEFQILSKDVGRFNVSVVDSSKIFSDQDIYGDSGTLISRPFALSILAANNPSAMDSQGDVFIAAGVDFPVTVSAVGWQAADDINGDGIADGHDDDDPLNQANLSDNVLLPSFSNPASSTAVQLRAQSVAPEGISHQELNGSTTIADFTAGRSIETLVSYSNVGIIELSVRLQGSSYLGADANISSKVQGRSGTVGRFIPDHFSISLEEVTPACLAGAFTHVGQEFTISARIEAHNRSGQLTDGYHADYIKLSDSIGDRSYRVINLSDRLSISKERLEFEFGVAQLNADLLIEKLTQPDAPISNAPIALALEDLDGVKILASQLDFDLEVSNGADNDHALLGINDFYFSRLNLTSAHGPETENLTSKLYVESWQGNSFQRNTLDSCTTIRRGRISYVQTGSLSRNQNRVVSIGSGQSLGEYSDFGRNNIHFTEGDAGQYFTAPGIGNRGVIEVDIDLERNPWLQYDWNKDGSHNDRMIPRATFQFGGVRGHDSVVYWRETN